MGTLESKLYRVYTLLQDKVVLFADDEEIAQEFRDRADRIRAVIDTSKFVGAPLDSSKFIQVEPKTK
jgi:hypothetical protein